MTETLTVLSALLVVVLYAIHRGHSVTVGVRVGPKARTKPGALNGRQHPAGGLVFRSELGIKAKRPGQRKPFNEQRVGATFHRDTQTWRKRHRLIDRDADRYVEVITDADGREVHRCEEPLSAHVGHGSAKRREG